jgi:site-specific recombinase XerD
MVKMPERSKRIETYDKNKLSLINAQTLQDYRRYKIDMEIRELSPKTVYNYELDLFQWFTYIYENQGNICVREIIEDDIVEFLHFCKTQGNNSRRMKRRMSSISAFYKFLRKKKLVKENPMEMIDRPRKDTDIVEQTYLSQEQVALMRDKLIENKDTQLELYANLSLSTMARVNAISNIRWEQIDFDKRKIDKVLEKEQRYVTLRFNEKCKDLFLQLREERRKNNIITEYVFSSFYGGQYNKVSNVTLNDWCKKIGEMIGVESLHPHDFRHTSATLLKNSGMPLESISKLLNHMGTDVTLKFYIKEDEEKIQQEKDKYDF